MAKVEARGMIGESKKKMDRTKAKRIAAMKEMFNSLAAAYLERNTIISPAGRCEEGQT